MSVNLDPITIEKMDRFGRRRRRMVWTRGICSATVSILVLMSLVALADWRWVLSDSLRWTLSGLGYAGAAVVVWMTCLRLILRSPDQRNLARRVETAEPQLRENLLSAIELTTDDASEARDSSTFRQLLQNHVGLQMADVDIRTLLPVRLLGKWLVAAAAIVIACATLLSLPGLPFRQLMTRAMLPGANIDRVSRIQVTILQPTPHSLILPQEETVAVLVEISGGHVDEVTLELQGETNGVTRQQMRATDAGQFVSNVSIGNESIEYRVLAGDAVTRKYRIDARPRPHVKAFHKTFRFPDYAALDDRIATDPHGDLIALEGTEVDLVLDIDQDVTQAEIRLDRSDSDAATTVALGKIADRRFRATLTLDKPGIYKVHLVSKETGFDNPFSPKYEIKPEPDLIPRVGFVGQQEGTLLLPPNDILPLEGLAEDDLPLVALEQHISVNGLPWEKASLKINEARRVTTSWQWDLLELNLKSGDQVTTKLVATDRKGNTGESVPLNVVVSSPDFDPDRHAVMRRKSELYDMLVELNKVVSRHQASAEAILKRVREADRDIALKPEDRASVLDLAGKVREETDRVSRHILQILPTMPSGADAYELELVSRVMARIQHESMNVPRVYLDAFTGAADPEDGKKDLQRVLEAFSQSAEDTSEMANRYQQLLAHNIMAAIAYDLDALLQHQRQLVTSRAPLTWQRLVRQETVAINHIHILERLIDKHLVRLPASTQRAAKQH